MRRYQWILTWHIKTKTENTSAGMLLRGQVQYKDERRNRSRWHSTGLRCSIAWLDGSGEKSLTLRPREKKFHIREDGAAARRCTAARLRREQLPQINNSASSLSRGTSDETGRCRTNRIRRPLKLYMALGEPVSPARGLITLDASLIRTQLTQHIRLVEGRMKE